MFEIILKLFKKWKDTLNVKLKPPVGGSKSIINIVTEPNHLNGWFIQEQNTVKLLRDAKLFCGGCLELFLVGEIEQKQAILGLKSLNINLVYWTVI